MRSVRIREQRLELVDDGGRVRIATDPVIAVDARGSRLPVDVRLTDSSAHRYQLVVAVDTSAAMFPVIVDPAWSTAPSMSTARSSHTATVLKDGRVLVVGGQSSFTNSLSTAEIYDPASNTWSAGPSLPEARYGHTATRLLDGRVLVSEGERYDAATATRVSVSSSYIFDPITKTFADVTSARSFARAGHTATLLGSGDVLLCGGQTASGGSYIGCEIYQPATNTWVIPLLVDNPPKMAQARFGHTATLLPTGNVLITGGYDSTTSTNLDTAEIFDVSTRRGTLTTKMTAVRGGHAAAVLPSGKILVAGGGGTASAEVFDSASATWTAGPSLAVARRSLVPVALASGAPIFIGGGSGLVLTGKVDADRFDVNAMSWRPTPGMSVGRMQHAAVLLGDGRVLVTGGRASNTVFHASTEFLTLDAPAKTCTVAIDCASGFCVDGVCCDSACDGNCEACDVTGSVGTCTAVSGAPHGGRPACDSGGSDVCRAQSCDGKERKTCSYAPTSVACGAATCVAGTATATAMCDGLGACSTPVTQSCHPYVCDGDKCRTTCTAQSDCATGYVCRTGKCVPEGATCSDDGLSSIAKDATVVPCAPYRCAEDGSCRGECATSDHCAPGAVCDPGTKTCTPAPPATDGSGGCALGRHSLGVPALSVLACLAAVAARARRRRPVT